eukprot:4909160-Pyramimonas_sp.AAC.1
MSGSGGKPWPHKERGRRWYSHLRHSQLHVVGSFAWLILGTIHDYEGATVTIMRGVEVLGMAFRHDSGSSRRSSQ